MHVKCRACNCNMNDASEHSCGEWITRKMGCAMVRMPVCRAPRRLAILRCVTKEDLRSKVHVASCNLIYVFNLRRESGASPSVCRFWKIATRVLIFLRKPERIQSAIASWAQRKLIPLERTLRERSAKASCVASL